MDSEYAVILTESLGQRRRLHHGLPLRANKLESYANPSIIRKSRSAAPFNALSAAR